jgi:hypothetical protein
MRSSVRIRYAPPIFDHMATQLHTKRLSAQARQRNKRISRIKAILPLLITFILLASIYIFVLAPDRPDVVLRRVMFKSFDQSVQKSWRYDGSMGDKDQGLAIEFNGQKASNSDNEFFVKLEAKDKTVSYHVIKKPQYSYYYVSGWSNLQTIIATVPGASMPDSSIMAVLAAADNAWVRVPAAQTAAVESFLPCKGQAPQAPSMSELKSLTSDNMPIKIVGGPYVTTDGSQSHIYDVSLDESRKTTLFESGIVDYLNCLDTARKPDYRLRKVTKSEISEIKVSITIDRLSETFTKLVIKQYGQYLQVGMHDYNKDVVVREPADYIESSDLVNRLDDDTKVLLLAKGI